MKCLLVILEKFKNSVFHMFHDSLLGAHYGPMNTYYTIKDRYWIHTCLRSCKVTYLPVMYVNNKNRKVVRFLIFIQEFLLITNPNELYFCRPQILPKGIYNYECLLIVVCEITGFVVAIPLINMMLFYCSCSF